MGFEPTARFHFASRDGLQIACARWDASGPKRGSVQIAHGMGEHIGRYWETIEAMVVAGFTVYGNDHRGHGRTAPDSSHFGDYGQGGFDLLVEDMVTLSGVAHQEAPDLPLILMGHSMGSFAAQQYVLKHSGYIDALVLSGSGVLDGLAALAPAGVELLNAAFEPARTPADWLSRDAAAVDAFLADPLCFPQLQPASLHSFLAAGTRLASPDTLAGIRRDLPIYLFSGEKDPVGQQTQGVRKLIERYRAAGLADITFDFYPGGRHEMLNEINRAEVRAKLMAWVDRVSTGTRSPRQ
ncbi:alpha/beta fold hydrolase [Labrys sp. KB_33_2]|uniref:alpha/beta fold hydrolase n=1 Tax=Labrys sp. KB_33_2 TaxID=3237479 RepID=UPI003F90D7BC